MSFGWAGSDLLAATKLAWDLYHNCYLVARDAPDEFRQLVNELASLQGVLRTLRDDVYSDKSFSDRIGDARKRTLERCLNGCYGTLRRLNDLVVQYRKLGVGDGLQFWRRIKFAYQKSEVADLKAKVMVHTCNLSLCMSAIGNSSLSRIETQLTKALERQEASEAADEQSDDTSSPLKRSRTNPAELHEFAEANGLGLRGMQRQFTDITLVDRTASPESTPSMSEEDASDLGVATRPTAVSPRRASRPDGKSRRSVSNTIDSRPFPPNSKIFDVEVSGTTRTRSSGSLSIANGEPGVKGGNAPNVLEVVAEAMKELSRIRQREQSQRPLRIVPQDPVHRPDDSLREKFQESVNDESKVRSSNARDWLRVATWWLLKARNSMEVHEKPHMANVRGSFSRSSDSRSPSNQAYVDLLKASWILYEVILKGENLTLLLTDENRKLFYNLSDGIKQDFDSFRPVDIPDKDTLYRQNLNIWEFLQPEEENMEDEDLSVGIDNGRWVTVEQEDAGEEDETVHFRTFVDAKIGVKRYRIKSKGAPYLLLLSTKEGESEPRITICNQSGTLGLSREFTLEDLRPRILSESGSNSAQSVGLEMAGNEDIPLHFGMMRLSVNFTSLNDFDRFMSIPERYFSVVNKREPRELKGATETLLFRSSVEVFEQLKASTVKPLNPRQLSQSCDLRVLETTGPEGWRTTRRLVVSSSAGERRPWSTNFFLPLSRVQLCRDGISRQILAKWSNCQHEILGKTDGNYNKVYSYSYDDSNPNIALSLQFRTQADATDFENTILKLNLPVTFKWSTGLDSRFVYDVSDTEPTPKKYKALMITRTRLSWKYSELYYMYRDADYHYDHANLRVRFPQVYYTDYISTHVDKLYEPRQGQLPKFSHCVKKVGNLQLTFDDSDVAQAYMNSLTGGHELVFSRRAHWITTKPRSRFGNQKSNKGNAEVQLWRKNSPANGTSTSATDSMRLVSRWDDHVEDKWMTMAIPPTLMSGGADNARDSNRAVLPRVEYDRGRLIDMANMVARNPRAAADARKTGPVTIAFQTVKDREEFSAALEGVSPPRRKNAVGDLLGPLDESY